MNKRFSNRNGFTLCGYPAFMLCVFLINVPFLWAQQEPDPRDLVVMLEWKDPYGGEGRGAGIIINQNEQETLIVTAKHNLLDLGQEANSNFTVEFRPMPGQKAPAEALPDFSTHDIGLLRVAAENAVEILGTSVPKEILNLNTQAQEEEKVFVVGYGGGVPWSHTLRPEPAQRVSVAEIQIQSQAEDKGQSGGGVFDQDWALMGMIIDLKHPVARALPIELVIDEVRRTKYGVLLESSPEADQQAARRTLAKRNIPWSVEGVANALTASDVETLRLFSKSGIEPGMLLEALGSQASEGKSVARIFFERSKGKQEVMEWLQKALAQGLDPNAAIKSQYYQQEGLLNAAVRAGNSQAVKVLVKGGASPHAYQDLWFTEYEVTRFLQPFNAILEHEIFSRNEKKEIMELFMERGAIIPEVVGYKNRSYRTYQPKAVKQLLDKAPSLVGIDLAPNATHHAQKRVCEYATKRDGFDWCAWEKKLPKRIWATNSKETFLDFSSLELLGLINVLNGKGYFMGVEEYAYRAAYDLVEVSSDMQIWHVYRYMQPGAGMGHCQDGRRDCWRRVSMTYYPKKTQMMVKDYYPYQTSKSHDLNK